MSRTARLGMFILGALTILAMGIFLIGRQQGLFRSGYTLKAEFENVSGLQNGAQVRVGGIDEGTVKLIQLPTRPDAKVVVVMELAEPTRSVVKKDSIGAIRTEGMVGAKFVEVSFGSKDSPPVQDGDMIGSESPIDFTDLLKKTNTILDSTTAMTSGFAETAENLASISSKINGGQGSLGALVNDKKVYTELNATTAQAAAGATAFKDDMQALQHNFFLRGFFHKRGYTDAKELTAHETDSLPSGSYSKKFPFEVKQLFGKPDSAKLKSPKDLDEAGKFLESNPFGLAIVLAYTGAKGDSEKDKTLTQVRAMLVRDYLVNNFKLNDTRIKTMGLGKNTTPGMESAGGIDILIYPAGSEGKYAGNADISGHQ